MIIIYTVTVMLIYLIIIDLVADCGCLIVIVFIVVFIVLTCAILFIRKGDWNCCIVILCCRLIRLFCFNEC